jgi:ATP-dependent DNA helicase RecQ
MTDQPDLLLGTLSKYWGYKTFREPQREIIESALAGEDSLILMPTAGGKSLCYQLPALLLPGCTIVISPLIALIKDQVNSLQKKGIAAAGLDSSLSESYMNEILQNAISGKTKLLFLSPERLKSVRFRECLHQIKVSMWVVDEAHCISQWGYDFRPSYLQIAIVRNERPLAPCMALTASATPWVQADIISKLQLKQHKIFAKPFHRPQLSYSSFAVESKLKKLTDILKKVPGSGLVYCNNRRKCTEIANHLRYYNIQADYYHAGLPPEERNLKQEKWMTNQLRVIVCTSAFGMGIDKPDVRTVIHYDMPDSLETYYQEAGRAGRDEQKSYAVLLAEPTDMKTLEMLTAEKFPDIQQVKLIYQYLADFLQVPVGSGKDQYFDFDIAEFTKNFKLNAHTVFNMLRLLEQEGFISFSENNAVPSSVQITAPRETWLDIEKMNPSIEPLFKILLRVYEGIADNEVPVYEKHLSRKLQTTEQSIRENLSVLMKKQVLIYRPQKNTPQIYFLSNRAPAAYLNIDIDLYLFRKSLYESRLRVFLEYVNLSDKCRSAFITSYFSGADYQPCGICDNCIRFNKKEISSGGFETVYRQIEAILKKEPLLLVMILKQLNQIPHADIWQALNFLLGERKIIWDERGLLRWKE